MHKKGCGSRDSRRIKGASQTNFSCFSFIGLGSFWRFLLLAFRLCVWRVYILWMPRWLAGVTSRSREVVEAMEQYFPNLFWCSSNGFVPGKLLNNLFTNTCCLTSTFSHVFCHHISGATASGSFFLKASLPVCRLQLMDGPCTCPGVTCYSMHYIPPSLSFNTLESSLALNPIQKSRKLMLKASLIVKGYYIGYEKYRHLKARSVMHKPSIWATISGFFA